MAKPMKMKPGVLYAYNSENGTFKEEKVAKGNPRSKHDNDYRFGEKGPGGAPNDPSGQNLPPERKWKA
jgi:hypothetical protein